MASQSLKGTWLMIVIRDRPTACDVLCSNSSTWTNFEDKWALHSRGRCRLGKSSHHQDTTSLDGGLNRRPQTLRDRPGKPRGGPRPHRREGETLPINMDTQEEEPKVCTTSVIVIQCLPCRDSTILYLAFLEHSTVMVIAGWGSLGKVSWQIV